MNILLIIIYYFYYILYSYHNHSYFISIISYTKKTVSCKIVRFRHSVVHLEAMKGLLLCANAPDVPNNRNVKKYLLSKLQHNGFFILYSSFFI